MTVKPFGFYDRYRHKPSYIRLLGLFIGEPHFGYWLRFQQMKQELAGFSKSEVLNILEIGTAEGKTAIWLAEKFSSSLITSLDINPVRVEKANSLVNEIGLKNLQVKNANITNFAAAKTFDIIICNDVLEHVEQWEEALLNMLASLKDGGTMLVHVPHNSSKFLSSQFGWRKYYQTGKDYNENKEEIGEAHLRDGFLKEDFVDFIRRSVTPESRYLVTYTFGWWHMYLHTVFEYFVNRYPRLLYLVSPLIKVLAIVRRNTSEQDGGGLKLVVVK